MTEAQAFGEWLESAIKAYRDGRGLPITQKEFARAIDVSPPLVSHWIGGTKRPSADMVLRVAEFFGEDYLTLMRLNRYQVPASSADYDVENPDLLRILMAAKVLLSDPDTLHTAMTIVEGLANETRKTGKVDRGDTQMRGKKTRS